MRLPAALAALFLALAACLPAHAQPPRRIQRLPPERLQPPQRELPPRGADELRQVERSAGDPPRPGRLSPEERLQLRRDIREHGREVYRERPRRFQ